MNAPLPPEIQFTETPEGVHYRLPRRRLGALHLVGLIPAFVGVIFCAVSAAFVGLGLFGGMGWVGLLPAAFAVPFFLAGLVILAVGVIVLAGHGEVGLDGGRLYAIERVGWLRWRRWRPAERVRRFGFGGGAATVNGRKVTSGPLADVGALTVECDGARPMLVSVGYPTAWLQALANDLAPRFPSLVAGGAPAVSVFEHPPADEEGFRERAEQPAGSLVLVERHADGVTLTVPAAGLWRGTQGLFFFSLLWLVITTAVTAGFAAAWLGNAQGAQDIWPVFLILPIFWLVGVGMLLGAVNMGRRRAVLAVVGDTLMVLQTGLLGGKQSEWPREQLGDVRTGPSGMEVNERPVLELQILPREGKKFSLLAGREASELAWMATELRRALRLAPPAEGEPPR